MVVPFAFHCIICFEDFHATERPPVILPCGHTYLCLSCAKRLKKCMECRKSLMIPGPTPAVAPVHPVPARQTRHRGFPSASSPASPHQQPIAPQKVEPLPYPMPKNLVLIALMETAEREAAEEEELEERVTTAMTSLTGPAGTYAVRERNGLAVLPNDPRRRSRVLRRSRASRKTEPFSIEFGQLIQIADIHEGGIFQLSRNEGFVVATDSQLVKVGGPRDDACQKEGILSSLARKKKELQEQLREMADVEAETLSELSTALNKRPTFPTVAPPEHAESRQIVAPNKTPPASPFQPMETSPAHQFANQVSPSPETVENHRKTPERLSSRYRYNFEEQLAIPSSTVSPPPARAPPSPAASLDSSDIGAFSFARNLNLKSSNDDNSVMSSIGCIDSSLIFGSRTNNVNQTDVQDHENSTIGCFSSFDSVLDFSDADDEVRTAGRSAAPSPSAASTDMDRSLWSAPDGYRDGIRSTESYGARSYDSSAFVDFRTGRSGHRALTSSAQKKRASSNVREIKMMSTHSGIGPVRGKTPSRSRQSREHGIR